jgi:vancomycin aglycone glucosyltransferase
MRVLLSTIGSRGDVQPLVALALQLRALGQEAHLCVPPDFREWIDGLGFPVTPIGPTLRTAMASSPPAAPVSPSPASHVRTSEFQRSPEFRRQMARATVATQFDTITAAAKGCDIIVGATVLQIAARSVAERMGIPYVFTAYCPNVLPSAHHAPPVLPSLPGQTPASAAVGNHDLWARDIERFNDLFGDALNSHRASLGLAPVHDARSHVCGHRPWLAADRTLGPWPESSDQEAFQTGAWLLPDDRPLARELETFLEAGEPPVYFGFGSMRAPHNLGQVMVSTARALGRRALVSRGWADLSVGEHDPDCLVIGEVNQQALFTRVAAVVHHGGAGTTTAAALAGAPQVVIPQMYDQHYWAQRAQHLGIGTAHASGAPTVDSLRSALARVLQPSVAVRAQAVARIVRLDGAFIAAQRLVSGDHQAHF